MKNMSESANSAKSAKQIFANFAKFVKPICGTTRRSEGSVTEAEYPTNYQRISNLSLTIRPFRVAILAVLLVFVGGWNSEVWGAWSGSGSAVSGSGTTWYVVDQSSYETLNTIETGPEITLSGPGSYVSYEAKGSASLSGAGVKYFQYLYYDGSWHNSNNQELTTNYKGYDFGINTNVTKIKFRTVTGSTLTKEVKNIMVTMAQYIEDPSETSLDFGSGNVDDANTTKTFTIAWCNVPAMTHNVSGSGSDKVSVSITNNASYGKYNTATVTVTYNRNTASELDATLTISDTYGSYSKKITLKGSTSKYDQTLSWNGDVIENMLQGTTQNCAATATSGLAVSYTSNNSDILSVDANGKLTANAVGGLVSITASQAGNYKYNAATSLTRNFYVKTKETPIFTPDGFTHESTNDIDVGDVLTLDLTNVSDGIGGDFKATYDSHYFNVTRVGNTLSIEALNAGTGKTVVISQTENTTIFGLSRTYTFNISKITNTLDVTTVTYEMFVDAELGGIVNSGVAIKKRNNNDVAVTVTSTDEDLLRYVAAADKVIAPNTAKEMFGASKKVTLTFSQPETYKYTAASKTIEVTVRKYANTIYVKGSANYSNSIYVDSYDNGLILSADNTDYTNCPITNTQTAGSDVATFYQNDEVVYSSYKLGTATWTLSQPENYKYQAGNGSFTVNVIQQSAEDCYLLNEPSQYRLGKYGTQSQTYSWFGRGAVLSFKMWKHSNANDIGNKVYIYDASGKQLQSEDYSIGSMSTSETSYTITLNADARSVKFQNGGGTWASASTLDTYIKDIKVSRATWLNIATDSGNNGTLTINKKSDNSLINPGQTGVANSKIYWSCVDGGDLKIVCENPHFSFSQNTITNTTCNNGTTDITVSYTNTEPGTETATVTVYNKMYRQTFTVKGVIEKADQLIAWHNDILRLGQSYTDVATANTLVTYESEDESIIRVDEDGEGHKTILTAVGTGTVNITATAEESSFYAEKSSTKGIKVTEKQIQWIDWNQSLFGLKLDGANVTMNAVAASDVEDCVSSRLIEYSSNNESVVKVVNNNQLQIIGVGTAIITAVQAGGFDTDGHDYERAETEKTVIVRDPNAPCESFAYQQGQEVKMDCGWNASDKQTRTSEINFNDIIPATGTLRYKGENRKVAINYFDGTMSVEQYIPGEDWKPVTGGDLGKPSIGTYETANLTFDRRATKMRVKVTDGLGYHYFTDCQVTQARFIETTAPVDFNLNVGQQQNQVIYLSYSNITDGLSLTLAQGANSHFSVDKSFIEGSCGSAAKNVALTITYHPTAEETNVQDVLTITDGTTTCQVVLTGSATRVNRHIIWDHADETNIYTVQTETLSAEARTDLNELAGTVAFSLAGSSTAAGSVSAENVLSFTSAGVADVVAYTKDDPRYNVAPNVVKTFNVAITPTQIQVAPTVNAITSGDLANINEVVLNGGKAVNTINGAEVEGTFAVTSGDVINAGTNTLQLTFTPSNTDMYSCCTGTTTIVVNKAVSVATPSAANIVYGQKVSESVLSNDGTEGTWTWTDAKSEEVLEAGTYDDLAVHFTPSSGNYTELDATVSLTVEKAAAILSWTAAPTELEYNAAGTVYSASSVSDGAITYSIVSGNTYAEIDALTGELTILEPRHTIIVQASQAESNNYNAPTSITVEVTIGAAPLLNVFTNAEGDGDWGNENNWESGIVPTSDLDIIVTGALEIKDDITVGSLTIESTGSVAVISGGTLTVNGTSESRTEYGDVHVMNDGALALGNSANLQVRDFTLDASLGNSSNTATSGQVSGHNAMDINGKAYFELTFDPSDAISFGWYDFTVPFKVNIAGGIARIKSIDDKVMVSGVDFMIMEADEQNRANGGKGWRNVNSGALQPGKLYTITFNYQAALPQNTFRFTWNGEGEIANGDTYATKYATGGDGSLNGWNGLGNGMLRHGYLAAGYKLQAYCHETNTYDLVEEAKTFAVGSAFFIQVAADGDVQWTMANATVDRPLYAPKRAVQETEEFRLSLFAEESEIVSDYLFFSASEDATEAYIIGHDLLKMGTPTDSKVARMWAKKGGKNLCDIEAALVNNKANCALGLYAPKAGSYWLAIDKAPEDASLYLTYNGRIIWNLSVSPYMFDLSKGSTIGYGLKLHVHEVATDIEQTDDSQEAGVRKVLIGDQIYIITSEGAMYDLMGKSIKY